MGLADSLVYKVEREGEKFIRLFAGEDKKSEKGHNSGRKTEVYPYEVDDVKKLLEFFAKKEKWGHYLALTLSCNMARRAGDIFRLQWKHFFNPDTGSFRSDILEIKEEKTDKLANPHINSAVRKAIRLYCDKTGTVPQDDYEAYVFLQKTGTHVGKVMTEDAHLKALKTGAKAVGIEYNIGTHSGRKFFGMLNFQLHPGDVYTMPVLQRIFNHSDAKTTMRYIGLEKKRVDQYYDDMGEFFDSYITGNQKMEFKKHVPIISIDAKMIREILVFCYNLGIKNAGNADPAVHQNAINQAMDMIEEKMVQ